MVRSSMMKAVRGRIIDGTGKEPIPDGVVSIDGGRITSVGRAEEFQFSPEINIHDVGGGTILPGIIDSHVHTDGDPETRRKYLACGVTSICDLGSPLESMPRFADEDTYSGEVIARGFRSGPILTVPGGLPGALFLKELTYDVGTVEDACAGVNDLVGRGADVIKVYLDPWFDEGYPVLSVALLKAIVEEAHANGVLVRAHVNKIAVLETALDGGVDVLEHVPLPQPMGYGGKRMAEGYDVDEYSLYLDRQMARLESLIPRMVDEGVVLVPTLSKLETSLRESPFPKPLQSEVFRYADETVRRFHDLGGVVALGTDTIVDWGNQVGMPVREMALLLGAGLSQLEVIEVGTRFAAMVCGKEAELGTLEAGKHADLIVVEGDPLEDVSVFNNVSKVVIGGEDVELGE